MRTRRHRAIKWAEQGKKRKKYTTSERKTIGLIEYFRTKGIEFFSEIIRGASENMNKIRLVGNHQAFTNHKTFYKHIRESSMDHSQYLFRKDDVGYSVVRNIGSYGYNEGLWEMCKIAYFKDEHFELIDEPIGFVTVDDVVKRLEEL
ncbi:hypothetical protein KYI11_10845 [Macrococcoides bohemicum]|uniref:Uncharacterized protein n=1 Tax=Macrococcoides bohemicum TaxID=1903056 RepID=A0AAJ4PAT1_9STAP|nr:hypothetical protein [Macrococcus bohemicus]QYA42080.1 hypothetical protein KYI11_10845 [Macrococcus bohemicus]